MRTNAIVSAGRALALCLLLVCLAGCFTTDVYNVNGASFPAAASGSEDQVAALIRDVGTRQGWVVEPLAPGRMRATYKHRRHRAVVAIEYSGDGFSIDYVDSSNLQHDGDSIHVVYNEWIKQLEAAIQREAGFRLR